MEDAKSKAELEAIMARAKVDSLENGVELSTKVDCGVTEMRERLEGVVRRLTAYWKNCGGMSAEVLREREWDHLVYMTPEDVEVYVRYRDRGEREEVELVGVEHFDPRPEHRETASVGYRKMREEVGVEGRSLSVREKMVLGKYYALSLLPQVARVPGQTSLLLPWRVREVSATRVGRRESDADQSKYTASLRVVSGRWGVVGLSMVITDQSSKKNVTGVVLVSELGDAGLICGDPRRVTGRSGEGETRPELAELVLGVLGMGEENLEERGNRVVMVEEAVDVRRLMDLKQEVCFEQQQRSII